MTIRKKFYTYILRHLPTNSFYIGSTGQLRTRTSQHKRQLELGTHKNKRLQRIFTNWADFSIELYYLAHDRDEAFRVEQELLNDNYNDPKCMNIHSNSRGNYLAGTMPEEEKQKQRKPKTEQGRRNIAAGIRSRDKSTWRSGFKLSDEHRAKIAAANKGKYKKQPKFTADRLERHRLMAIEREAKLRRRVSVDGVIYDDPREAAKVIGICYPYFLECVRGPRQPTWFYVD